MTEEKKPQKRVSFACETPEHNIYEREATITTDDTSVEITYDHSRVGISFYKDNIVNIENNDLNIENNIENSIVVNNNTEENIDQDTIMSNTTVVFDELINTQYIRTIVPPYKQVNINEILIDQGIRFLDDIVVSSTRRETLSKSKKEIDPQKIIYYKNFLIHRIKFFDEFSEYLKDTLCKLEQEIINLESTFDIKGSLLEKEDKSKLRNLKSDCRNKAYVSWYEIRSKKELEFNEKIGNIKNDLINEQYKKENLLNQIRKQKEDLELKIEDYKQKIKEIVVHEIEPYSIGKIKEDIQDHTKILEEYKQEYKEIQDRIQKKKINEEYQNRRIKELKEEIYNLEKQFKKTSVTENDLNEIREEYEKISSILGVEIVKYKKDTVEFNFLLFNINIKEENIGKGIYGSRKRNIGLIRIDRDDIGGIIQEHTTNKNIQDTTNNIHSYNKITVKYKDTKIQASLSQIHEYGIRLVEDIMCVNIHEAILEAIRILNIIEEIYKEIYHIPENNKVLVYIQDRCLYILIDVYDNKKLVSYKVRVEISPNMDILIVKDTEEYLYNLYINKGVISYHIEQ